MYNEHPFYLQLWFIFLLLLIPVYILFIHPEIIKIFKRKHL